MNLAQELPVVIEEVEEDQGPNILRIPSWNLPKLDEKIAKLNKKAVKAKCPPIAYKVISEESIVDPAYIDPDGRWKANQDRLPHITMFNIEIIGEGPKIEGWKFLGTFDHVTLPGSVIVNTVPGETVPTKFHNCEPVCDHCGKKRIRNETFLLQEEETGDYKLIGRQCVRDFIGYDARAIFNYLSWIRKLENEIDEDEYWGGGGGQWVSSFNADKVLAVTASIIHKYGWVSKSKADYDQTPTSGEVIYFFFPPKSTAPEHSAWERWVADLDADNEKWATEAANARAWLKEQTGDNEYMHNLHAIDDSKFNECPVKLFGYWCSLMSVYQRAMETLREQEKTLRVNEHVGTIKQRRDFNVKLHSLRVFEGQWGNTYLHNFLDNEGHTLIWWASREQEFKVGEEYTIKATVKKHDEYKEWAQTLITRVKEVSA